MCYMTLLSTTSVADLSLRNNEIVRFSAELPGIPEQKYLAFPRKWFVGSQSGCSCSFRHLCAGSIDLGFGEPEDWFPEEASDIEATRQVATVIRALVESGESVDCVDAWAHGQLDAPPLEAQINVSLADVSDTSFRFFENHRFTFLNHVA